MHEPVAAFFVLLMSVCSSLVIFTLYCVVMYQIIYRAVRRAMRETQPGKTGGVIP